MKPCGRRIPAVSRVSGRRWRGGRFDGQRLALDSHEPCFGS